MAQSYGIPRQSVESGPQIAGKILTVSTGFGGKSKQVGTIEPEALTKHLLFELVKAGKTQAEAEKATRCCPLTLMCSAAGYRNVDRYRLDLG